MSMRYEQRPEEAYLHKYAQHNENCERIWGLTDSSPERGEFQRDRERVVNSRAFRRMVDKAQIFTSSKGDHYRTRMTHTMEVAQIARSIANSLQLNIDLTEAIALGHDLGHTPFGHQGERTLNDILLGRIDIGLPVAKGTNVYGGFKHNVQSVRMLNVLEEKYIDYPGLDISYHVLEGVLKHTKFKQKQCDHCELKQCGIECCDLSIFLEKGDISRLFTDYHFATTLEGQIVAIADEIAQRSHDVDDAMSAHLLDDSSLRQYLDKPEMKSLRQIITASCDRISAGKRKYVSINQITCARIISDIINYLVNDVVRESKQRIEYFASDDFYEEEHRFSERLIDFSGDGRTICETLEEMVSGKVIGSSEIAKFDYNADKVVKALFRAYYNNPMLLHKSTLKKAAISMSEQVGHVVDFQDGKLKDVKAALGAIIGKAVISDVVSSDGIQRENWIKHTILVRAITDYIAGMTDSYAMNEYHSFVGID